MRLLMVAVALTGVAIVAAVVSSAVSARPANALARGIDVASWQHPGTSGSTCGRPIDWAQVRGSGVSFAYAKATQSTTYTNPCFAQDWAGIAAVNMLRGAYHYAEPSLPISTAADQARFFVSRAGSMTGRLDLPGMLDLEETGGLNATDLSNWTRTFLDEVTRLTGKRPVLYMGAYFFPGTIAPDIPANYRLWIPSYPCQDYGGNRICDPYTYPNQPRLPAGWSTWTFWQFSSIENVPGVYAYTSGSALRSVDMNWFCCDFSSLMSLLGGGGTAGSPFGAFETSTMTTGTTVAVSGWAVDPDTRDPIPVHVYFGGVGYALTADGWRPDIAAAFPGFGEYHGFSATLPVPQGATQVCAYGINIAAGGNTLLGCRPLGGDPFGIVDVAAVAGPGRINVSGWAIDPNGTAATRVTIRAGGVDTVVTADQSRPDLVGFGQGTAHGWSATVAVPTGGSQQVCVSVENSIGPGSTASLGCRTVVLPSGSPIGVIDVATGGVGSISLAGWTLDPDTAASIDVHVYVDGVGVGWRADRTRDDVGAVFPGFGSAHGFTGSVSARGGPRTVCVYGINVGVGTNVLLGCRTVQVIGGPPFGFLDSVTFNGTSIDVAGWAIDPNTTASIPVHVYIGGIGVALTASNPRPDLAGPFPSSGIAHGFTGSLPAPSGTHSVCAYGIDVVGGDGNSLIGCRTITVPPGDPFGYVDAIGRSGGLVSGAGWAIDPNTVGPVRLHIYVNGVGTEIIADGSRPDVGAAFGLGANHGWSFSRAVVGSGVQHVCVYVLNAVGPGSNQLIGCWDLS